jgi:TolA-binding protein
MVMKKTILVIVFIMILGLTSFAYAGTASGSGKSQNEEGKAELLTLKTEFAENKAEIQNLKDQIDSLRTEVKAETKILKNSDKEISSEQLDRINASLQVIKADRIAMSQIDNSELQSDIEKFKEAKDDRNWTAAAAYMENALEIQGRKLEILRKTSADMKALLEIL